MVRAAQRGGGDTCPAFQSLGRKLAVLAGGARGSIYQTLQGCLPNLHLFQETFGTVTKGLGNGKKDMQ